MGLMNKVKRDTIIKNMGSSLGIPVKNIEVVEDEYTIGFKANISKLNTLDSIEKTKNILDKYKEFVNVDLQTSDDEVIFNFKNESLDRLPSFSSSISKSL